MLEERDVETWDGMAYQPPPVEPMVKDKLEDEEAICDFASHLMTRFGGIEAAWEWLDIDADGVISESEFFDGDFDTGPPFASFPRQDRLRSVWSMLDRDGNGTINVNEFNQLMPYFQAVQGGHAALDYEGVYCMVPHLEPGSSYRIMARACNVAGASDWTRCHLDLIKTDPSFPLRMLPIESDPEWRSLDTIKLRWRLPHASGDRIRQIELKHLVQDVEDGRISYEAVARHGKVVIFEEDPTAGGIAQELVMSNLLPGQIVTAVARAYNSIGSARQFSEPPGPGSGDEACLWSWDTCTFCAPPDTPSSPVIDESSLRSEHNVSQGAYHFEVGKRNNGRQLTSFEVELFSDAMEVLQTFSLPVSAEESEAYRLGLQRTKRAPFCDLAPGKKYRFRVRTMSYAGASNWSDPGPWATMPPDVPNEPDALLSELTSLEFIEMKWNPPHDNGAPIRRYEIRYALSEYAPEHEWITIPEATLEEGTRRVNTEPGKQLAREKDFLVFRLKGLKDGTTYFFTHRAWNAVGHSKWSEVSRFMTKTSKPCRLIELWCKSATSREVTVAWTPPESNGVPLTRHDLVGGPNIPTLRWCQIACALLDATVDAEKLFGYKVPDNAQAGEAAGTESFGELYVEECMYAPILMPVTEFTIEGLLPGQDYFFIARGVANTGKGEFSAIMGPFTTKPEEPKAVEECKVYCADDVSCSVYMRLPYNMGSRISEITVVLTRLEGPLAVHEYHPETGKVQDRIASQQITVNPADAIAFNSLGDEPMGTRQKGMTAATRQCFEGEGLQKDDAWAAGRTATLEFCTGQVYMVSFGNLRPGSKYEVSWSCRNNVGRSPFSIPIHVRTLPAVPDRPPDIMVSGL